MTIDEVIAFFSLTKAQRDAIAEEDFAGPDGSFPIDTQKHLDDAAKLIGHADDPAAVKKKAVAIARRKGFKLPEAWETKSDEPDGDADDKGKKAKMATFAMFAEDQTVVRSGKIFECDRVFTDQAGVKFGVTTAEADCAIAKFTPVDVNLHHGPSLLDGRIGKIQKLWRDGNDIVAEYSISKAFHDLVGGRPVPVSSEWDTRSKLFTGGAVLLDRSPAVADAVMMAAAQFAARHDTQEGQYVLQSIHDEAARAGAVCKPVAKMAAAHEAKAVQSIHDLAVEHGALCSDVRNRPTYFCAPVEEQKPTISLAPPAQRTNTMTFAERLKGLFTKAGEPAPTDDEIAQFAGADTTALKTQFAELQRQNAALMAANDQAQADQFAEAVIGARKELPSMRKAVIARFMQAVADDRVVPAKVKFASVSTGADGKPAVIDAEGSRVDALMAEYAQRPAHRLFDELLRDGAESAANGETVIFSHRKETAGVDGRRDDDRVASKAEKDRLLNQTELGRQALAAKGGK